MRNGDVGTEEESLGARAAGRVYLVGAGPGDPSLLTLKAARLIGAADVVVYDDLVNPAVLEHARPGTVLVRGGRRAGRPSVSQPTVNSLLVEHARAGRVVVRLKGGDPFVFGRGGEEAETLEAAGVSWEVVPGVSAGVAAAAYAGIPLTHRDLASSVAFVTGHDADEKSRDGVDWREAARLADTLVVFMCARTIGPIARELVEGGRAPATPIAIVRSATYDRQEVYLGTLGEVAGAGDLDVPRPAIAVVGEVAALHERLRWFGQPARPISALVPGAGDREVEYEADVA